MGYLVLILIAVGLLLPFAQQVLPFVQVRRKTGKIAHAPVGGIDLNRRLQPAQEDLLRLRRAAGFARLGSTREDQDIEFMRRVMRRKGGDDTRIPYWAWLDLVRQRAIGDQTKDALFISSGISARRMDELYLLLIADDAAAAGHLLAHPDEPVLDSNVRAILEKHGVVGLPPTRFPRNIMEAQ